MSPEAAEKHEPLPSLGSAGFPTGKPGPFVTDDQWFMAAARVLVAHRSRSAPAFRAECADRVVGMAAGVGEAQQVEESSGPGEASPEFELDLDGDLEGVADFWRGRCLRLLEEREVWSPSGEGLEPPTVAEIVAIAGGATPMQEQLMRDMGPGAVVVVPGLLHQHFESLVDLDDDETARAWSECAPSFCYGGDDAVEKWRVYFTRIGEPRHCNLTGPRHKWRNRAVVETRKIGPLTRDQAFGRWEGEFGWDYGDRREWCYHQGEAGVDMRAALMLSHLEGRDGGRGVVCTDDRGEISSDVGPITFSREMLMAVGPQAGRLRATRLDTGLSSRETFAEEGVREAVCFDWAGPGLQE